MQRCRKLTKQPPVGRPNDAGRSREYLTPDEVERMIAAARCAGITLTVRAGMLHISRLKHGSSSTHPLRGGLMTRRTVHYMVVEAA
jgi:hypothetical protein